MNIKSLSLYTKWYDIGILRLVLNLLTQHCKDSSQIISIFAMSLWHIEYNITILFNLRQ